MKTYILNMKRLLEQANWKHEDFPIIARFFANGDWEVTEDMLIEVPTTNTDKQ